MGAEQLRLHHFRKAENGVERRAQLVAHRGEEAGLREIGFLGAPARHVAVDLGLFEFGDQFVLFRSRSESESIERA